MKNKFEEGQAVEVKILGRWHPARMVRDEGGGWYTCEIVLQGRSDMFTADNVRAI